jgi:hypothetical protein
MLHRAAEPLDTALMSALAHSRARTGSRPPAYGPLVLATLSAQILTGLALWVVQFPFALLGIAPSSAAESLWVPWSADGLWSGLGVAAYVLIVCVLGGSMVARRVECRKIDRPAAGWAWLAFGAAGYAAIALGHSSAIRVVLAVVLAPLTLRLLAYRVDGARRPWPSRLSPGWRGLAPALVAAVALVFSYSATHAFAQNGSAGSAASVGSHHAVILNVGLRAIALPSQITSVSLDGHNTRALRVLRAALSGESGAPGATSALAGGLPARLRARTNGWLAVRFIVRSCTAHIPTVDAITLHYRVLGIATSERVPLWRGLQLDCKPAAAATAGD